MKKEIEILPPTMPNFIKLKRELGKNFEKFPIIHLSEKGAEKFGELMKQEFLQHYRKMKRIKFK